MRDSGFYWVRWTGDGEGGEPLILQWKEGCWQSPLPDDAFEVLSERLVPPGAPPAEPVLLDVYKQAALIGKRMGVGGRIEVDGRYCKMLVRNPKQRAAKAAPTAAKSRAARTRR